MDESEHLKDIIVCVDWILQRIELPNVVFPTSFTPDIHEQVARFLDDNQFPVLLAFCTKGGNFKIINSLEIEQFIDHEPNSKVVYFLKTNNEPLTSETIYSLQHGVMLGHPIDSLLQLMINLFLPNMKTQNSWPDAIKVEFSSHLHRFMAELTENAYQLHNLTVLYVPQDPELANVEYASSKKHIVQLLESVVIYWTHQIQEAIAHQENVEVQENEGPLDEIEFWQRRVVDLNGIRSQIKKPEIKNIITILQYSQSTYLQGFSSLTKIVEEKCLESMKNYQHISILRDVCEQMNTLTPGALMYSDELAEILNRVRLIWSKSLFYSNDKHISTLIKKISNQLICICIKSIDLTTVLKTNGNTGESTDKANNSSFTEQLDILTDAIGLCERWKALYLHFVEHINSNGMTWDIEISALFAHVDAFVQRCRDLGEICEYQLQFSKNGVISRTKIMFDQWVMNRKKNGDIQIDSLFQHNGFNAYLNLKPMNIEEFGSYLDEILYPVFSGAYSNFIFTNLSDIENHFNKYLLSLSNLREDVLNVKITTWYDEFALFKQNIKHLEIVLINLLMSSFDNHANLENLVFLLESFKHLVSRENFERFIEKKILELWSLFGNELTKLQKYFDVNKKDPPMLNYSAPFSSRAIWASQLLDRLTSLYELLSVVLPEHQSPEVMDIVKRYQVFKTNVLQQTKNIYSDWVEKISEHNYNSAPHNPLLVRDSTNLINHNRQSPLAAIPFVCNFDPALFELFEEVKGFQYLNMDIPYSAAYQFQDVDWLIILKQYVTEACANYNEIVFLLKPEEQELFKMKLQSLDVKYRPGIERLTWQSKNVLDFLFSCKNVAENVREVITDFKNNHNKILTILDEMKNVNLLNVKKKHLYSIKEFEEQQDIHMETQIRYFLQSYNSLLETLLASYIHFEGDGPQVQKAWMLYILSIENILQNNLKKFVKTNLNTLFNLLIGGSGNDDENSNQRIVKEIQPLFNVSVILSLKEIKLSPDITEINSLLRNLINKVVSITQQFPRLFVSLVDDCNFDRGLLELFEEHMTEIQSIDSDKFITTITNKAWFKEYIVIDNNNDNEFNQGKLLSYYQQLNQDNEIKTIMNDLLSNLGLLNGNLKDFLKDIDRKYKHLWLTSKEEFFSNFISKIEGNSQNIIDMIDGLFAKLTDLDIKSLNGANITVSIFNLFSKIIKNSKSNEIVVTIDDLKIEDQSTVNILQNNLDGYVQFELNNIDNIQRNLGKYKENIQFIQTEEMVVIKHFLYINLSVLKNELIFYCNDWINGYVDLLYQLFVGNLHNYSQFFKDQIKFLNQNIGDLGLLENVVLKLLKMKKQLLYRSYSLKALHHYYQTLQLLSYGGFEDDIVEEYENLPNLAKNFLTQLNVNVDSIEKTKVKFRDAQLTEMKTFGTSCVEFTQKVTDNAPKDDEIPINEAFEILDQYNALLEELKAKETRLQANLLLFNVHSPDRKDLMEIEQSLANLREIWELKKNWLSQFNVWKNMKFLNLKLTEIDNACNIASKKLNKLGRDLRKVNVWAMSRQRVEDVKKLIPLIEHIKNPALQKRHWKALKEEIGQDFDTKADDFTLQKILDMKLIYYSEIIESLSITATQEQAISNDLNEIETIWRDSSLIISATMHREGSSRYYLIKIEDAGNIFAIEEEHITKLTAMRANRYVASFLVQVEYWDKHLSTMVENLELFLQVQRDWVYMDSIFSLSEGITRQLPLVAKKFDIVTSDWNNLTQGFVEKHKNHAFDGLTDPEVKINLKKMFEMLESIQKSLEDYLETKRMAFPRFYFLSNDDLLEWLGKAHDRSVINRHIKKCFFYVSHLQASEGTRMLVTGMYSNDGELLQFSNPITIEGSVEDYMHLIEKQMVSTMKLLLFNCYQALKQNPYKREKWIKQHLGQLAITTGQVFWTGAVEKALMDLEKGQSKNVLKYLAKRQMMLLTRLTNFVRAESTNKLDRLKTIGLITIEVHGRDVIQKLYLNNVNKTTDFDWTMQLRFSITDELCYAHQTDYTFDYQYEYLGNPGRLVVTPLTDRCYLTLTTALALRRGGNPQGPAGTGKTETVRDLAKAMGTNCAVFNCSEGLDYKSVGRMFSGLVQTGGWGCFDEFNRIDIEVLSVVAQQVSTILEAISGNLKHFMFEGRQIKLNSSCGIFVTMNPGYAGRTELPDNLKSLFRPISMMRPDFSLIAEISLYSEGFTKAKVLSKKITSLFNLMFQQLSKQDHYDFGMRAIKSVLVAAGNSRRSDLTASEEIIVLRALRDSNLPKLIAEDAKLFDGLIQDLMPGLDIPEPNRDAFLNAMRDELKANGLQVDETIITKAFQLYETKAVRHGVMIVGLPGSGKSTTWHVLKNSMTRLSLSDENFVPVHSYELNPKVIELYGEYNLQTREWKDGVLSVTLRNVSSITENKDERWIVFDGPIDTLWIESMNTVLDDNKVLTLINSERIAFPNHVSFLFETRDLAVASPATVSRCGMVYFDRDILGWRPYWNSWLEKRCKNKLFEGQAALMEELTEKYLVKAIEAHEEWDELVPITILNAIQSFCVLFDTLAIPDNGVVYGTDKEGFYRLVEMYFAFTLTWTLGGAATGTCRKKFDMFLRTIDGSFPPTNTVFEYYVDFKRKAWAHWSDKLSANWKPAENVAYFKHMVPTASTVRFQYLLDCLLPVHRNLLIVGETGVGKSSYVDHSLNRFVGQNSNYNRMDINFSAQTSSQQLQGLFEEKLEHRQNMYIPKHATYEIAFIDDFNMPAKEIFGAQPPLELLRQYIDYGCWYDLSKQTRQKILNLQFIAAMGPPGGGRQVIDDRLQSRFHVLNIPEPDDDEIKRIFGTLLSSHLQSGFEESVLLLSEKLIQGTTDIYHLMVTGFLPTPSKSHYIFNLRDVSKVIQGLLMSTPTYSRDQMLKLWIHEMFRVFGDKLADDDDNAKFLSNIQSKVSDYFDTSLNKLCKAGQLPMFGDFMSRDMSYQLLPAITQVQSWMVDKMCDYDSEHKMPMNLVLFNDALQHICRINRILKQPRGNVMLVGVGGSGRQSLTRLAAYIAEMDVFQIELASNYGQPEFRADMRNLYKKCGLEAKPTVFLLSDAQVTEEIFFEDINNILSNGQIPQLFEGDELMALREELTTLYRSNCKGQPETHELMWAFFIERVRTNLHVVLCMSPVGDAFRDRVRQFPALVSCTTIDWFNRWPADALLEVAERGLEDLEKIEPKIRKRIAEVLVSCHTLVEEESDRMGFELRRSNFVTPTSFLQLVEMYVGLNKNKEKEIVKNKGKLETGLSKLLATRKEVEVMTVKLDHTKIEVANNANECDALLVELIAKRTDVDAQAQQVEQQKEILSREEADLKVQARQASEDLDRVMPILAKAELALQNLNRAAIADIKVMGNPPYHVQLVCGALMILLKHDTDWSSVQSALANASLLTDLQNYPKESITDTMIRKLGKFTHNADWNLNRIKTVSEPSFVLAEWIVAMEEFAKVNKVVAPKKARVARLSAELEIKQSNLREAEERVAELKQKIEDLNLLYAEKDNYKKELERQAKETEDKLRRADSIVNGLADERGRWEETIALYEIDIDNLPGDCLLASAFLSYAGPFPSEYRAILLKKWSENILNAHINCSSNFKLIDFLVEPTIVRSWNIQGLPSDNFSIENGILVQKSVRWPLMIDPQSQANKWIRNLEEDNSLKILTLSANSFVRDLEMAIRYGDPVLLENVGEEIDPILNPILNRDFIIEGGITKIRLGDKLIDYNESFKLFLTTKLHNPTYSPEISAKTTIVNFAVKEKGLEEQLLGLVVQKEMPKLEEKKNELVLSMAEQKRKMVELEDKIVMLLNETDNVLEDETLVNTLTDSKTTSEKIKQDLLDAQATEKRIDESRENYRTIAERASILFFVLNDMARVDPMYQFSLDSYIELFSLSISKAKRNDDLKERISDILATHTLAFYRYVCRGLFAKHKLLLSFQMCIKIMMNDRQIEYSEYQFFLRGGVVLDKAKQLPNPQSWLAESAWDNIHELAKLPAFHGLLGGFESSVDADLWKNWYQNETPEFEPLPADWESKLTEMQKMLIVRCLREDRILSAVTQFVSNNLGEDFIDPPTFDLESAFTDSTNLTPLIFILSPGVDPYHMLASFAQLKGMSEKFRSVALGQGQTPIAESAIEKAMASGGWVLLANCHLSVSWLPDLEKIIASLPGQKVHPRFRLWLSSNPHPKFPISILQSAVKITTEPPRGVKANMLRIYGGREGVPNTNQIAYKRMLFGLAYFHSLLIERRKFMTLGWNVVYDFNDSDFEISERLLRSYLQKMTSEGEIDWKGLRYLTGDASYGGRVTDDWDRRLLKVYMNDIYSDATLNEPNRQLCRLDNYFIPADGHLQDYVERIQTWRLQDPPEIFGQHFNADIASAIQESQLLLDTVLSLQPRIVSKDTQSREEVVLSLIEKLKKSLPKLLDIEATRIAIGDDVTPLTTVLLQEMYRYNVLLEVIEEDLLRLEKGIQGLVVISPDLEDILNSYYDNRVPAKHSFAYPSIKPLASWIRDLDERINQMRNWGERITPLTVFWLAGFTFPTGFLTALLQTSARRTGVPIDTFAFEFNVMTQTEHELLHGPSDGAYIKGLYLEGARWDVEKSRLAEPHPMVLVDEMPIIHFKPIETRKRPSNAIYQCPAYMYPVRTGTRERPSYVTTVELACEEDESNKWIKRGTALLLSLST
eukprot:TRINITY_DN3265_c0_g2_i1.p1 TRINITY_DN3265_c0_g2~~TRINITY_DN3265_c0_g2_i1.p1  ORF type:complete len:4670 (+),score=1289.10 TRINITY_DN3265_c0_g2_i1:29-14038(+)